MGQYFDQVLLAYKNEITYLNIHKIQNPGTFSYHYITYFPMTEK